jgi:ketosteroid isomerase-like protein
VDVRRRRKAISDADLAHYVDSYGSPDQLPAGLEVEEYRTTWELFFANNRGGPGSFEVTDLRIAASDTVAYCHALLKIFDSTARLTMGLRKEGGQWRVAHEHHSYPAT